MKPPRIVNSSEDASLPRYTCWSESTTVNRRTETSMDVPTPAIDSPIRKKKNERSNRETREQNRIRKSNMKSLKQTAHYDQRM